MLLSLSWTCRSIGSRWLIANRFIGHRFYWWSLRDDRGRTQGCNKGCLRRKEELADSYPMRAEFNLPLIADCYCECGDKQRSSKHERHEKQRT